MISCTVEEYRYDIIKNIEDHRIWSYLIFYYLYSIKLCLALYYIYIYIIKHNMMFDIVLLYDISFRLITRTGCWEFPQTRNDSEPLILTSFIASVCSSCDSTTLLRTPLLATQIWLCQWCQDLGMSFVFSVQVLFWVLKPEELWRLGKIL